MSLKTIQFRWCKSKVALSIIHKKNAKGGYIRVRWVCPVVLLLQIQNENH